MEAILVGYFAKRTSTRPPWVHADNVEEIASVSECLSPGPEGWVDQRLHNAYWFFDSPEKVYTTLGEDAGNFDLYAYKLYPLLIHQGKEVESTVIPVEVAPLNGDFHLLGYDAVSRSNGTAFECSPLSCNDGAQTLPVNRHCLFESYEAAMHGAIEFSKGEYEPGPYYIFEVYRLDRFRWAALFASHKSMSLS